MSAAGVPCRPAALRSGPRLSRAAPRDLKPVQQHRQQRTVAAPDPTARLVVHDRPSGTSRSAWAARLRMWLGGSGGLGRALRAYLQPEASNRLGTDGGAGVRGVDHQAVAEVDAYMAGEPGDLFAGVEEHQVAGVAAGRPGRPGRRPTASRGCGAARSRRPGRPSGSGRSSRSCRRRCRPTGPACRAGLGRRRSRSQPGCCRAVAPAPGGWPAVQIRVPAVPSHSAPGPFAGQAGRRRAAAARTGLQLGRMIPVPRC